MNTHQHRCFTALTLFVAFVVPIGLLAQDATAPAKKARHHHYQLIDMGTFGGSSSCINEAANFVPAVNSRGNTVGTSATAALQTSTSNPTAISCGGGPNIFHGFEWREGAVTDLGTLAGPDFNSDADSINANGVVEGISENGLLDPAVGFNQVRAVIWKDGQIQDLGTLGGLHSWSFGINNSGQVVGMALNTISDPVSMYGWVILGSPNSTQTRAFLWQHGTMLDLGTLGGPDAWAWAINEKGQVLGLSYTNSTVNPSSGFPTMDPFLWEGGEMRDIGTLGGVVSFPVAFNQRGQVIGGSSTAANPAACWVPPNQSWEFGDPNCHPFFWDGETLIDLNTSTPGATPQTADAINNAGEIVGRAAFPTQIHDAYLRRDGAAIDLGHLDGDCDSRAYAINMHSQIVGGSYSSCSPFTPHAAFLWEEGSLVDLNSLIPPNSPLHLLSGLAINDHGEIAGNGVPPGVSPDQVSTLGHAFLLIPCDDDHPGIEGCDYSIVEASAAVAAPISGPAIKITVPSSQAIPAFGHETAPVLRRGIGRHFGPGYRGMGAESPVVKPFSPEPPANAETEARSGPLLDESQADPAFAPWQWGHHGYCEVYEDGNQLKLNGECFAQVYPLCRVGRSSKCPVGQKVDSYFSSFCGGLSAVPVSGKYPCTTF